MSYDAHLNYSVLNQSFRVMLRQFQVQFSGSAAIFIIDPKRCIA